METKNLIENKTFDEERALYNLKDTEVRNCTFAGPQDGESVLKETRNIRVIDSKFSLRYPLWHAKTYELSENILLKDQDEEYSIDIYSYGKMGNSICFIL